MIAYKCQVKQNPRAKNANSTYQVFMRCCTSDSARWTVRHT